MLRGWGSRKGSCLFIAVLLGRNTAGRVGLCSTAAEWDAAFANARLHTGNHSVCPAISAGFSCGRTVLDFGKHGGDAAACRRCSQRRVDRQPAGNGYKSAARSAVHSGFSMGCHRCGCSQCTGQCRGNRVLYALHYPQRNGAHG